MKKLHHAEPHISYRFDDYHQQSSTTIGYTSIIWCHLEVKTKMILPNFSFFYVKMFSFYRCPRQYLCSIILQIYFYVIVDHPNHFFYIIHQRNFYRVCNLHHATQNIIIHENI